MIVRGDALGPEALARALLETAAEVEAAEAGIKQAILDAATAGDCRRVIDIVTRWRALPSSDVLAGIPLIDAGSTR